MLVTMQKTKLPITGPFQCVFPSQRVSNAGGFPNHDLQVYEIHNLSWNMPECSFVHLLYTDGTMTPHHFNFQTIFTPIVTHFYNDHFFMILNQKRYMPFDLVLWKNNVFVNRPSDPLHCRCAALILHVGKLDGYIPCRTQAVSLRWLQEWLQLFPYTNKTSAGYMHPSYPLR